jgi:hypothetical protein
VSLSRCCRLFGISRQAIYQAKQRAKQRALELGRIKPLVQAVRMQMPRLGTRKLYFLLKDEFVRQGIKVGRDALFDYLRGEHLLIKPKKNYTKTTNSKHWLRPQPVKRPGSCSSRRNICQRHHLYQEQGTNALSFPGY